MDGHEIVICSPSTRCIINTSYEKQANGMPSFEDQLKLWMTINCVAWCTWIITYNVHATNQSCCETLLNVN